MSKIACAPSPWTATSSRTQPSERIFAAQKCFLQRETVLDACAGPASAAAAAAASVQAQRRAAQDAAVQISKLLEDLRVALAAESTAAWNAMQKATERKDAPGGASGCGGPYAVAEASSEFFRKECGLEVNAGDLRLEEAEPLDESITRRLHPLRKALTGVNELRKLPGYKRLVTVSEGPPSNALDATSKPRRENIGNEGNSPIPSMVKALQEALERCIQVLESGFARCARSVDSITAFADWAQPLTRLANEFLQMTPLDDFTEEPRERLRRAAFDVEEKEREQENAVTDGDMVRSEQLYFEKTSLLEAMRPHYETLEKAIEAYRHDAAEGPTAQLRSMTQDLNTRQGPPFVAREEQLKRRALADIEKLDARVYEVRNARSAQHANFKVYLSEWEQLFDQNRQQQESCLRAMEELEQRLGILAEERTFLVEDRLENMSLERQREEDAAAFMIFAEKQECALRTTLRHVEQSLHCAQTMQEAVQGGCKLLGRHIQEFIVQPAQARLLEVRKERLEHFRGLYLTLGELQFKKERHLEELDKRIEYYHVQQELAMDTFNPKAKEFSKAKKDLLEVKETLKAQVMNIAQKATKELEDFRPTEKLLRASGVQFRHPEDDLADMNARRKQKLLEYHSLMSTMKEDEAEKKKNEEKEDKWKKGCGGRNEEEEM